MDNMDPVKELETDFAEVQKVLKTLGPKHARQKELAKELETLLSENTAASALLNKRIKGIDGILGALGKEELLAKYGDGLATARTTAAHVAKGLPLPKSRLLALIVGSVPLWKPNMGFRITYKKEYEEYKKNFTWIIILFSAVILYSPNRIMESFFQFMLMFFYSTVTIREHILIVNGSRIRGWWMTHQYLAIGQSVLLFAWPDSASYDLFRTQFFVFSLYLGLVQLLQYWYQSRALYAKIAMAGTSGSYMQITNALPESTTLATVILALTVGYVFQLYNAWSLGWIYLDGHPEWQVPVLALNFFLLGAGNIRTTYQVLLSKWAAFKESRATKSS